MSSWVISRSRYLNSIILQQYEPVFLGTQGVMLFFATFISACRLAATSERPAPLKGHPPPSTTVPHRLPVAWLFQWLGATTRTAPWRAVSVPANTPGRHS